MARRTGEPAGEADESRRIIERATRESASPLDAALRRLSTHLRAGDAPADDRVEVWGRRVGRVLSIALFVALLLLLLHRMTPSP